jgi:hypothetical protein
MGKPQKSVSFVPDYTSAGCLFYDYLPHSGFVQQGKFTRTAKSAACSSLCFLSLVICSDMRKG